MFDFYIFFRGDMLLVNIFAVAYFFNRFLHGGGKGSRTFEWGALFVVSFYWIIFLLSFFLSSQDVKGIARFIIMPALSIFVLISPIKLPTKAKRGVVLFLSCYVLFYLIMVVWHYFSSMWYSNVNLWNPVYQFFIVSNNQRLVYFHRNNYWINWTMINSDFSA